MSSPSPSPSPSLSPSSSPLFFLHHQKSSLTTNIIIGTVSFLLLILLLLLLFILHKKRNKTKQILNLNLSSNDHLRQLQTPSPTSLLHASSHPLTYLDAATDGFHPSLILGHGPLGTVYTATSISGDVFAVKRMHSHLILTNPGLDFSSRLKSLSFINHPNVLPILGYSEAPGERVIITELSTSLEHYLHGNSTIVIGWRSRIQIAAGAARGIQHLHGGGIVHGRVKASNIMVHLINPNPNSNYHVARVCDYGLSFLGGDSYYKLGFEGCMDDVLGFGMLLLEVLSGKKSSSTCSEHDEMLGLIRMGRVEEMLDQRVGLSSSSSSPLSTTEDVEQGALVRMAKVALACVGNGRRSRPEMGQVAAILNSLEMELVNNCV